MIKSILKLGVLLVVGILIYNYFLGTPAEKQQSKEVFSKVKDIAKSGVDLLKSEHAKMKEGKYDEALDKVSDLYDGLKDKAQTLQDSELLDKVLELEKKRQDLSDKIAEEQPEERNNNAIEDEWNKLVQETEDVLSEIKAKEQGN